MAQPQQQQQEDPYPYQQAFGNTDLANLDLPNTLDSGTGGPQSAFDTPDTPYTLSGIRSPQLPQSQAQDPRHSLNMNGPSNELVRRAPNNQLAPPDNTQETWVDFGDGSNQNEVQEEQELGQRVAQAKQEAQGKRKQIPPFVQKLSSFLDSGNTDLIRWSDDGKAFIVLDESEFARTLIPELFKHDNYASFVRQLNMYGFHKTVNITDGSLRQSEKARKGVKPPSMYWHPYFRKNRPDLLWLIQKPSAKSSAKRKRDGSSKEVYNSDDDRPFSPLPDRRHDLSISGGSQDLIQLPRGELSALRSELQKLQTHQVLISQMINHLKEQNDQFYRQAAAFQVLHDRHENSINAILTFLATFYNKSMEGHGAQNLVNMFSDAAAQGKQGGVVEEFNDMMPAAGNNQQLTRYSRRGPLLLPPGWNARAQQANDNTDPTSARTSHSPPHEDGMPGISSRVERQGSIGQADTPTSDYGGHSKDHMMNLIHNANANVNASHARATAGRPGDSWEFSNLVDQFARQNGGGNLSPQQLDNVRSSLSQNSAGDAAVLTTRTSGFDGAQLHESRTLLGQLEAYQKSQDAQIADMQKRLEPLSPRGVVPSLSPRAVIPSLSPAGPADPQPSDPYDLNNFLHLDDGQELDFDAIDHTATAGAAAGGISWSNQADPAAAGVAAVAGADVFSPPPSASTATHTYGGALAPPEDAKLPVAVASPVATVSGSDGGEGDGESDGDGDVRRVRLRAGARTAASKRTRRG